MMNRECLRWHTSPVVCTCNINFVPFILNPLMVFPVTGETQAGMILIGNFGVVWISPALRTANVWWVELDADVLLPASILISKIFWFSVLIWSLSVLTCKGSDWLGRPGRTLYLLYSWYASCGSSWKIKMNKTKEKNKKQNSESWV